MVLGIIGAMQEEIDGLKAAMTECQEVQIAGRTFIRGRLEGHDAVVVRCGVGKVSAAVCTQVLIDHFAVTHIINTGIAGSLNNDIDIGDVVVSTDAVYHDVNATSFGYEPGEVPGLGTPSFKSDEGLAQKIEEAIVKANLPIHCFRGRVATGDQFIRETEKKEYIRTTFHADCTEMEGAAIAQTAWLNNIPFVIVRLISDKADESTYMAYDDFEAQAAANSAALLLTALKEMNE